MKKKPVQPQTSAINLRKIPSELVYRIRMAAAAEHQRVPAWIMRLIEARIEDLERKGILPKGK